MGGADSTDELATAVRAQRAHLIEVVRRLDQADLRRHTRNEGWDVATVFGHILATDHDRIMLLEGAKASSARFVLRAEQAHFDEIDGWRERQLAEVIASLDKRTRRWQELWTSMRNADWDRPVQTWWKAGALREVAEDWRAHDAEHAADIELAIAAGHE